MEDKFFPNSVALFLAFKRAVAKLQSIRDLISYEAKIRLAVTDNYLLGMETVIKSWLNHYAEDYSERNLERIIVESGLALDYIQDKTEELVTAVLYGEPEGYASSQIRTN